MGFARGPLLNTRSEFYLMSNFQNIPTEELTAVEIEINGDCNLGCTYCPNSISNRSNQVPMDVSLFTDILCQLQELSFAGRISYDFYNEPLLHPRLIDFVSLTKKYLPLASIVLYSNGTLLSEAKVLDLSKAGVTHFIITQHEQISSHPLQRFSLIAKENITFRHHSEMNKFNRGGLLTHIGNSLPAFSPCYIPSFLMTITTSGNVLPCFEDFHESMIMGNVKNTHLKDIWNSERFVRFRQDLRRGLRHKYPLCRHCNRTEIFPGSFDHKCGTP